MILLDAGALIAVERRDPRMIDLLRQADDVDGRVIVPASVLAQLWRAPTQVRLRRLLKGSTTLVVPLDALAAVAVGTLLGATGTRDVVDAHVVVVARTHRCLVVTSDPGDLRRLDPSLELLAV